MPYYHSHWSWLRYPHRISAPATNHMVHLMMHYSTCVLSGTFCTDSNATIVIRVKSWIVSALYFVPVRSHAPSSEDALSSAIDLLHKVLVVSDDTTHVCPHLLYDCGPVLISHGFVVQDLRNIAHELASESQVDVALHKATMSIVARVLLRIGQRIMCH